MDNKTVKQNVSNKNQWCRILYMILFAVILYVVMILVSVVVVVQLLFALFSGKPNQDIADFAADLSQYVYRIVAFLTYTDDRRPFPFDSWEEDAEAEPDDEDTDSVEMMGNDGQPGGDDPNDPEHK